MKKKYVKPDAEHIKFMTAEDIANSYNDDEDVIIGTSDAGDDGWVDL